MSPAMRWLVVMVAAFVSVSAQGAKKHLVRADPSLPSWLHVAVEKTRPGQVASIYQPFLTGWCAPYDRTQDPEKMRAFVASDDYRFTVSCSRPRFNDGTSFGEWQFSNPRDQRWPTEAVRIAFDRQSPVYQVQATVYCEETADECAKLLATTRAMSAPEPVSGLGDGSDWMHTINAQWELLVANEPCTPGPAPHGAAALSARATRRGRDRHGRRPGNDERLRRRPQGSGRGVLALPGSGSRRARGREQMAGDSACNADGARTVASATTEATVVAADTVRDEPDALDPHSGGFQDLIARPERR